MRKYIYLILLTFCLGLLSCEKFLEPQKESTVNEDYLLKNRIYAEGVLLRGYISIPDQYYFDTDIASDDAVSNDPTSSYRRMATGEWSANYDPISTWSDAYTQIYYMNKFLSLVNQVVWADDPRFEKEVNDLKNSLYKKRLKGEAFALRAYHKYRLLQHHGGKNAAGQLLGFPIIDDVIYTTDNWKLPRNTFAECVTSIFKDLDSAISYLPATWTDLPTGGTNPVENGYINLVQGKKFENRINGNTAKALKSRVALLAASPTFSASSGVTWAQAATISGNLLKELGSLYTKSSSVYNHTFYKETSNKEIIWNRAQTSRRDWETNNFPPSLYGNGRVNPTQNLVDAFPMKNGGYPIGVSGSGYNENDPYIGRDNRFYEYIVYNNATLKSTKINTYEGASPNGINYQSTSTRTGYYLKKLMLERVNLNPRSAVSVAHTRVFLRMTEVLLNYCEAANEAWGPTGDPTGLGFTAKDKIAECRTRAGINPDTYLESLATTTEAFRPLIQTERRISLCFEGFRFWDLRRWGDLATMKAQVKGAFITQVDGVDTSYVYKNIEERNYNDDAIFGPIPYNETLKYGLEQNKGW